MNFVFLLVTALLPVPAYAYKILVVPQPVKSHIFSLAIIAENLADRGHRVVFLVGEHCPLNLPELSNRTNISVVRHRDRFTTGDEVRMDCYATAEDAVKSAIELRGSIMQVMPFMSKMYVHFTFVDYIH